MHSLQTRLIAFFAGSLLLILLGTSLFTYRRISDAIVDELSASRADMLLMISQRTNLINTSIETITNLIADDEEVYFQLVSGDSSRNRYRLNSYMSGLYLKYYKNFQQVMEYSFRVVLIGPEGEVFWSNTTLSGELPPEQVRRALHGDGVSDISGWLPVEGGASGYCIGAASPLRKSGGRQKAGGVLVYVEEQAFQDCYRDVQGEGSIYIIDGDRTVLSHSDPAMLGREVYGDNTYQELFQWGDYAVAGDLLVTRSVNPETGWTIVEEIPTDSVLHPLRAISTDILLFTVVCGAVCLLLSFWMARLVAGPLNQFCHRLERNLETNSPLSAVKDVKSYCEIARLSGSYNRMIAQINRLMRDLVDKERQAHQSEIDFLRAQINPHFLYNTLFSIRCTIEMNRMEDASEMMGLLIDLMRESLGSDEALTTLEQVAAFNAKYVSLQRYRYGNDLRFVREIPPALSCCRLLRSLVQPIVENAIFHGIEPNGGRGTVTLRARADGESLLLDILDDGVGMPREQVNRLMESAGVDARGQDNIGLANIHSRIRLSYGHGYGLSFPKTERGTCVRMRIPLLRHGTGPPS